MSIAAIAPASPSTFPRRIWTGRVLSGLVVATMAADAAGKLLVPELMSANSPPLGLPDNPAFHRLLGAILAVCTILYALPRTAVLGAILLTAFLGGAVAAHLRIGSPLLGFTLVGAYIGVAAWAGLWLRDPRVRTMLS